MALCAKFFNRSFSMKELLDRPLQCDDVYKAINWGLIFRNKNKESRCSLSFRFMQALISRDNIRINEASKNDVSTAHVSGIAPSLFYSKSKAPSSKLGRVWSPPARKRVRAFFLTLNECEHGIYEYLLLMFFFVFRQRLL